MSANSRREFLGATLPGTLAWGASLAALRPSAALGAEPQAARTTVGQSYAVSRSALELDGAHAGWLDSVEGGDAVGNVVLGVAGPGNIQSKRLQGLNYEDIVLTCGTGMSKGFYDWIKAAFDRSHTAKNGAIVAYENTGKAVSRLEWTNGLITEIGFPACDASSKNPATITIKITPGSTRMVMPGSAMASGMPTQSRWLASNFRLQIGGCASACAHIGSIDAIVLKSISSAKPPGIVRTTEVVPGQLEVPSLAVMTAESEASEFFNWYEDFVMKGLNAKDKERAGALEYLGPDLRPFFTLSFAGLGIFRFAPEKMTAGVQTIRRVRAEMYCDSIAFTYA